MAEVPRPTAIACLVLRAKTTTGQPRSWATSLELAVGVDRHRVADRFQHRQIGDGVAVGVAGAEVVAAVGGQFLDRLDLAGSVDERPVELGGVSGPRRPWPRGDRPGHAQSVCQRLHDLLGRGRDDPGVASRRRGASGSACGTRVELVAVRRGSTRAETSSSTSTETPSTCPSRAARVPSDLSPLSPNSLKPMRTSGEATDLGVADQAGSPGLDPERKDRRPGDQRAIEVEEGCCHTGQVTSPKGRQPLGLLSRSSRLSRSLGASASHGTVTNGCFVPGRELHPGIMLAL